jgi:hypothetical protein
MFFVERLASYVYGCTALEDGDRNVSNHNRPKSLEKAYTCKEITKEIDCRGVVYAALSSAGSAHGVPSMIKSMDSAMLILRIARSADQRLANPKIDEFFEFLAEVESNSSRITKQGFGMLKVLSVEGLSGSGKSTLIQGLVTKIGARVLGSSIRSDLLEIRHLFKETPEQVKTALEFAMNYCIAYEIIKEAGASSSSSTGTGTGTGMEQLVVVEQFYHSVCAHTICANVKLGVDLNSLPASAFEWPIDLPVPTLVNRRVQSDNHLCYDLIMTKYLLSGSLLLSVFAAADDDVC